MVETKELCSFQANAESELYLSLVAQAWHSTLINQALNRHMSAEALIDIGNGKGVVSFWKKVDYDQKAEVLRRFVGREGEESEKADPQIWDTVTQTKPWDSFEFAAKYLTLHQLKFGKPWQAASEITGDKTRKNRARKRRG
ncbi:MAG: hypothetical protein WCT03_07130 [Candidatus Obscuribacterales bacterium]|jgi:hypothetical protein